MNADADSLSLSEWAQFDSLNSKRPKASGPLFRVGFIYVGTSYLQEHFAPKREKKNQYANLLPNFYI